MTRELLKRCDSKCELCGSESKLTSFELPDSKGYGDARIMICDTCTGQIQDSSTLDMNHWRCLNDSMWSPVPAVQVMAYRMLKQISAEAWARDLLDMLYLDEHMQAWADAGINEVDEDFVPHRDSNGAIIEAGDNVVIIKDLNVKGTTFTAKRGTTVRGISLTSNPEHIEGRVNGTRIVILTCFVKKVPAEEE
ncbi:PhnA domain-containing protein [Shewanella sp. D64]|uniref:PhnA domain-containing protein n=1 Tax=unclassified Shewanella TaxID=196818 RepID=UPI0022BA31A7|nr:MULTISPECIES: alkylphosphonate utilization protein [unclassified Shewanella]MEC4728618.1 PhnA domain-containing protein [Shewanella sp. D64]MEC4737867.1 PhnA domain-containing protein [Shewanella sp. E94]WBJ93879.1 PhnA domain-containing protein [Shewanella sp. MTB7]